MGDAEGQRPSESGPESQAAPRGPEPADTDPPGAHDDATLPPGQPGALRIRCPQCQKHIAIVDEIGVSALVCQSCGHSFTLANDPTIGWNQASAGATPQPRSLGHLELLERLGEGSFGSVWKARDKQLDRIVAVKIPRQGQFDPQEVEKFLREARAAAQLRHPNIVSVYEVGVDGETVFIVSEFIDGLTLADWMRRQKPTPQQAAALCRKIAAALHYAHEQGVIHRDLKPGNIMMDCADEPHIMDFGLAKREAGEMTIAVEGEIMGTPAYMSPEQALGQGHTADRRTDVYSLGVLLFELLSGERPFRGEKMMLLVQVVGDEPPPLRKFNGRLSRDLETMCAKCLEKAPARRYATAAELADDLGHYLSGEPIHARPVGRVERLWRWCLRNRAVAGLISAAALLLLVVAIVSTAAYFREASLTVQAEHSEAKAIDEAVRARKAENKAEVAATRATQSEEQTRRSLYFSNIALAHRYLQEGDRPRAAELLGSCPIELRDWEWFFLNGVAASGTKYLFGEDRPCQLAFSPNGRLLVAGNDQGVMSFYDLGHSRMLFRKQVEAKAITGLAFSPDGTTIATGSEDGGVAVWSVPEGAVLFQLRGHTGSVNQGIAFSPDGTMLATASADKTVRTWNVASREPGRILSDIRNVICKEHSPGR